jgi:hypothetical protein
MGYHSHYLLSKVVRARERLELELKSPEAEPAEGEAVKEGEMKEDATTATPPPPEAQGEAEGAKEPPSEEQKKEQRSGESR